MWFNGSLHWPVYNTGSPDSIWVGPEKRRDESFQAQAEKPLGTDCHQTISKWSSKCWLLIGHKKRFVLLCPINKQHLLSSFREFVHDHYWLDHSLSGSCSKELHAVRKLSIWYKLSISKYCLHENYRSFSKKLIQAWASNRYSHLPRSCLHIYYGVKDAMTADKKTSHEKWIRFFSVFIVIIPTRLLCQVQANSSGAEFLSTISKFIEKKKILSCCLFTSFPEHKNRHFDLVVV